MIAVMERERVLCCPWLGLEWMRWMMDESGHEKANGVSMNATVLEYSKID